MSLTDYSDKSLAVRVGSVIAHELGHCSTLLPDEVWHSAGVRETLSGYLQSTHVEAMADVLGVAGVLESGVVDWPTMRDNWGQVTQIAALHVRLLYSPSSARCVCFCSFGVPEDPPSGKSHAVVAIRPLCGEPTSSPR